MSESELAQMEPSYRQMQVVSFRLYKEIYALNILYVQEIIKPLSVTHVPLAPPWIAGVVNLRGQIIPLIYLSRRLGLEQTSYQRNTRFVIVRSREQSVGFVVDEVLEVLQLNAEKTEPPPGHLDYREYIHAVSKQERGMVMVLDLNKILYHHPQARIDVLEEAL